MSHIVNVGDADFESLVLQSEQPVLLDFWAPWCGPCQAITPVLEELSNEFAGKATVAKMNIDDNPNTPAQFGVRSIPTLLLFKGGQVVDSAVGALPKAEFAQLIHKHL